jgi:hypothetical protein
MARNIELSYLTLIAELLDRATDAQFDSDFDVSGHFKKRLFKDREYWYFRPSTKASEGSSDKYVGPADDPEISSRVTDFKRIKIDYKSRQRLVSTLVREARLFRPPDQVGDLLNLLAISGLFRLRACLVGTVAYQTYGTVLGYRMPSAAMQTGDIDIAQFHSIAVAVDDTMPPILDTLKAADPTFRAIPALHDNKGSSRFSAASGLRLDFLTPNRSSDEHTGRPAPMPALGGAAAEPLRFLDFLIRSPVRTVVLSNGGIPVTVPDPARFAVHKLIVAALRPVGASKDLKDLAQVRGIAEALAALGRLEELHDSFAEALERGPKWRALTAHSLSRLKSLGMSDVDTLFGIRAGEGAKSQ